LHPARAPLVRLRPMCDNAAGGWFMERATFDDLRALVRRLRAPDGCPWDRAQDASSLAPHAVSEAWELMDAASDAEPHAIAQELGDLLFVAASIGEAQSEAGHPGLPEALALILAKMQRRHPHVFGGGARPDWEAAKREEHPQRTSILDGIPRAASAVAWADVATRRAARVGFDWPDLAGVRAKLDEELTELDEAIAAQDRANIQAELGDVLFTLVNLARHLGVDAEAALRETNRKFDRRLRHVEARAEGPLSDRTLQELDAWWVEAKRALG
jgi:MazG family protein